MGKKAGKIALGLGLLTGAIAGLLFAPEEGKNVRKKLLKGDTKGLLKDLESMGDEIKKIAVDLASRPSVKDALDKAKDKAADVANMKRSELDALLTEATRKADTFKKKVAAFVTEQKAILDEKLAEKGVKAVKMAKPLAKKSPRKTAKKSKKGKK
ncbi:MAG: YtxH domain-containing protein [Candidatus Gracilibacteria bacterium]|jgi:gas vesicle protein